MGIMSMSVSGWCLANCLLCEIWSGKITGAVGRKALLCQWSSRLLVRVLTPVGRDIALRSDVESSRNISSKRAQDDSEGEHS